jgi:hypothetical protein
LKSRIVQYKAVAEAAALVGAGDAGEKKCLRLEMLIAY